MKPLTDAEKELTKMTDEDLATLDIPGDHELDDDDRFSPPELRQNVNTATGFLRAMYD
jgi:hypothetical protein